MTSKKLSEIINFMLKISKEESFDIFIGSQFGLTPGQYRSLLPPTGFLFRKRGSEILVEPYFRGDKLFECIANSRYPSGRSVNFTITVVDSVIVIKKERDGETLSAEDVLAWFEKTAVEQALSKSKNLLVSKASVWCSTKE